MYYDHGYYHVWTLTVSNKKIPFHRKHVNNVRVTYKQIFIGRVLRAVYIGRVVFRNV